MKPIAVCVVGVAVLVATLTACDAPHAAKPMQSATTGPVTMSTLIPAPAEPPRVSVQGHDLEPAYYDWMIDNERVVMKQRENQDEVPLSTIELDAGSELSFSVGSEVLPADFVVVLFSELDSNGIPIDSRGDEIDCLHEDDRCRITTGPSEMIASVQTHPQTRIVVIHLLYATRSEGQTGVRHVTGSWGMRLTS
jgi:hypothetical protein